MVRVIRITLMTVALVGAAMCCAQTVKPAFPEQGPQAQPYKPGERAVLKRRIVDANGDTIAVCDATEDPAEHMNCYIKPGRTVDELLDAAHEQEQTPCTDTRLNNTGLRKRKKL